MADADQIERAFTKGDHNIIDKKGRKTPLQLDKHDVNVVNLTSSARNAHGEVVCGLTTSSLFQVFKFDKPVKSKLKKIRASNKTEFPTKFDVAPATEKVRNGLRVLAFNVEYEASDEGNMNM